MRDESLCEACRDSVEQALVDSNIVSTDLPLDDWYASVMGIIQQAASHHFGVKSTSPRRHWMTPEAWNDTLTRQSLKTRNGSLFGPLSVGMGPLWEVHEISMREPDFEPFSWFEPPFCWV